MPSILITGTDRGIGLELARSYAQDDWRVLACCRTPEKAEDLQALAKSRPSLTVHRLDVTDGDQIGALARELRGEAIDILFNNAGVFGPQEQGFGMSAAEAWLETFRVNTVAPMMMAEAFVDSVAGSDRRIVATMGSAMGSIAENESGGFYAYRSSKAAVHMVMKGLSADLGKKGIVSVVFHPGWVNTRMGGPDAPLSPAESARGLKEVLTGLSAKDNGSFLDYTGGKRLW